LLGFCGLIILISAHAVGAEKKNRFTFDQQPGKVTIKIDGQPITTYVYRDAKILRPHFAHVLAVGGIQVTRTHPPVKDKDPTDHDTMHPGVWMAFGDINGKDFWRNKACVRCEGLVNKPWSNGPRGGFVVRNVYEADTEVICRELCRFSFLSRPGGYLIIWDSMFSSAKGELAFGDQEEMGLGVRVASPIMVKSKQGGRILDNKGRSNERGIWGKPAQWCDYSGPIEGQWVGITVMADPANRHPTRWHVRDYGLMVANLFGRKAFRIKDGKTVKVDKGQVYRMRYGVYVHGNSMRSLKDVSKEYEFFKQALKTQEKAGDKK